MLASPSAFAQFSFVQNDLYMGFQNSTGGGSADYIINFGSVSNLIGQSSVVDLSSDFSSSLFNNVSLQGTTNQVMAGVVGAVNSATGGGTASIYLTQLRTSNIGSPAAAGSTLTQKLTQGQDNTAEAALSSLSAPAAGAGFLDSSKSWEASVEPSLAGSFYQGTGVNPDSLVSSSAVFYEDLYETSNASSGRGAAANPFTYLGYFKLDLTGGSPKLTFTSTNVPGSLTKPIIISIGKSGSTVTVISSNAVPTFNYQLQYTASLSPTSWISVGSSAVAGAALVTNTDSTATDSIRFYRVQAH